MGAGGLRKEEQRRRQRWWSGGGYRADDVQDVAEPVVEHDILGGFDEPERGLGEGVQGFGVKHHGGGGEVELGGLLPRAGE
ncbi:hypothetical protein U1Q18_009558 [Sarracenia purpurea var. burkii]